MVNGYPLEKIPVTDWQASLAWVPQNPYLFNDTILANIKLAKPDADQSEVLKAVQLAHADEFIHEMPMGYQTIVGEHGVRLSAGQAQRIALARAFLKDAPFIILDEATSHLDPEADQLIRDSLFSLAQGRTMLVIAHHRATLSMAHQVITLRQGRIERIQSAQPTLRPALTQPVFQSPGNISKDPGQVASETSHLETNVEKSRQKRSLERRLFGLITPFTGRILLSVLLGFATVASGVGLMATAAYIISAAALHPSIADLQVAIVGVRFFGLSRGVFRYLERLVSHDVTFRLLARWRVWFYQALEPLAPARLMRYHSADLLTRVINDIGTLENFYVRSLAPPMVAFLVTLATLIIMTGFSTQIAAGLFGFLLLSGVGLPLLAYRLSHHIGQQIAAARTGLSILLVDTIQGIADLLVYGQAKPQQTSLNQASFKLNRLQVQLNGVSGLNNAIETLLSNLAMLAILVLAIQRVNHGQLDGVYLGVVCLIALTCFEALQPLPMVAQLADSNQAAASRLYELVDAQPQVIDPPKALPLAGVADLQVCDLAFKYPPSPGEVNRSSITAFGLSGVSFALPIGKHIALVGPNGSGKTTLVSLLLRFWEYQQGSIQLACHEYRNFCQSDIRRQLAVISQDTYLFAATIKENLLIAQPQASDEQLMQACQTAHLDDFIESLPSGLDTWIGEHGMRLSAGERQRLAIARAVLKASPILILDEPTANLDPTTELAVINSIQSLGQARATLTITQRMIGMEDMDQILVINNGHIIEQGNHHQLLASAGLYSQMWNLYHQGL
jgi:thiol reductant ABC exporter CydC subunit